MALAANLRYLMGVRKVNTYGFPGVCQATISRCLSGQTMPRRGTLENMAKALQCDVSDLLGEDLPTHIRQWPPNKDTCERKLMEHLQPAIKPQPLEADLENNMEVINRLKTIEPQPPKADTMPVPATVPLEDLYALFEACVDDYGPTEIFAQFGKQVYQLMAESKGGTK